jgi:hypothetical protein
VKLDECGMKRMGSAECGIKEALKAESSKLKGRKPKA